MSTQAVTAQMVKELGKTVNLYGLSHAPIAFTQKVYPAKTQEKLKSYGEKVFHSFRADLAL